MLLSPVIHLHTQPNASSGQKFGGALLNAVIFVAVIVAMTVVLVILFKYGVRAFTNHPDACFAHTHTLHANPQPSTPAPLTTPNQPLPPPQCYKIIFAYMGFAVLNIFFLLTGLILILLFQTGGLHIDAFSLCYILYNFSVSLPLHTPASQPPASTYTTPPPFSGFQGDRRAALLSFISPPCLPSSYDLSFSPAGSRHAGHAVHARSAAHEARWVPKLRLTRIGPQAREGN